MAESKAINALDACVLVTSEHSEASRKRSCSSVAAIPASKRQPRMPPIFATPVELHSPDVAVRDRF